MSSSPTARNDPKITPNQYHTFVHGRRSTKKKKTIVLKLDFSRGTRITIKKTKKYSQHKTLALDLVSYPFDSNQVLTIETSQHNPTGIISADISLHKKMAMAAGPGISPTWANVNDLSNKRDSYETSYNNRDNYEAYSKRDSYHAITPLDAKLETHAVTFVPVHNSNNNNNNNNNNNSILRKPNGPPLSKGRKNMKNLQLIVPPVRSSISAPNSPQIPQSATGITHNRRPSTPICVYQNKPSDHGSYLQSPVDPMSLISRTENDIGEDFPYKEEPICILPNLYLGTELNAANRSMLNRLNIEFILNVGKEVEVPYMNEIAGVSSRNDDDDDDDDDDHNHNHNHNHNHEISPGLSTSSSVSSDDSYQTTTSSLNSTPTPLNLDSPIPPNSPFLVKRTTSNKRSSALISRPNSVSLTFAQNALASGNPLIVPATKEFKSLEYKKFFWTHNQENLIADFISAFAYIDEAISAGRNILVHCQCGVSRSASLVIAYAMKANRMTLNQAYEFVKDRSSYISPNMSLVYQLVDFEKSLKLNVVNNNSIMNNGVSIKNGGGGSESIKSHSRSSSIESELLLGNHHRRSASLHRTNPNTAHNYNDSPPRTPGPGFENFFSSTQPQVTVKGGTGRFHVITATIAPPMSPLSTLPPLTASLQLSPTSSSSSPTTPKILDPISESISHLRSPSKPTPSESRTSNSSFLSPDDSSSSRTLSSTSSTTLSSYSSTSLSSLSSAERDSPMSTLKTPLSPKFPSSKIPLNSLNSVTTISSPIPIPFSDFDSKNKQFSVLSYSSHKSLKIDSINSKRINKPVVILAGQDSEFFDGSKMDNIFSPTRTASPIRTPSFSDLWGIGLEQKKI
ncbi:hypothetical protein G9A89_022936 [Geosiphon pyriformis]|nr:hypothetical protein G9A89_022936 [Geosiphon pyriformis]